MSLSVHHRGKDIWLEIKHRCVRYEQPTGSVVVIVDVATYVGEGKVLETGRSWEILRSVRVLGLCARCLVLLCKGDIGRFFVVY